MAKKSVKQKARVSYVFWEHAREGNDYYSHPISEIDDYLKREKEKGRTFDGILIESADLHHFKGRKIKKILRTMAKKTRQAYLSMLEKSKAGGLPNAEAIATQHAFVSPEVWGPNPPVSKATIGQVVLAAKHGLKIHFLEAYSKKELEENSLIHRFFSRSPEMEEPIAVGLMGRDLNQARAVVEKWATRLGAITFARHKRMLQIIGRVAKHSSSKAGRHNVGLIVPVGSIHTTLVELHKELLSKVECSRLSTSSSKEYHSLQDFPYAVFAAADSMGAGRQMDGRWVDRATLFKAVEHDLPRPVFLGAKDRQKHQDWKSQVIQNAALQIMHLSQGDFEQIAEAYKSSSNPMHEVLGQFFAKK